MATLTRRQGQRGVPRMSGRRRPPPGLAKPDFRTDADFVKWQQEWNLQGTVPEWKVFRELERRGLRVGLDFHYLVNIGGLRRFEGIQVDFIVHEYLAWAVQGVYFHYRTSDQRTQNFLNRAVAENQGFIYVEMLDSHILERVVPVVDAGLVGLELPGVREGGA